MDYVKLKVMIDTGPLAATLAPLVAAGNDAGVADTMNVKSIAKVGNISRPRFAMWAGATGMRSSIQDHANTTSSPLRSIALALLDFLQGGVSEDLDMGDPNNQAMLSAWLAAGEITTTDLDTLNAMATTMISIVEQELGQSVNHIDVAIALRGGV